MTRRDFCTYFDSGYLPRGLALHQSLVAHSPHARLWVLALDEECEQKLRSLALQGVVVVSLRDVEQFDPGAAATRVLRSRVEYYFTLTPVLPLYVLHVAPEVDLVTYLDADMYFFGDPELVFAEMGAAPIAAVEHRFPAHLQDRLVYGRYNVGWVSFRRDERGMACLLWWRDRCVEWCYDRLEGDRFADQKYLDRWPDLFPEMCTLQHRGVNVAPWNLADAHVDLQHGEVHVDGDPLVFFHFHGLTQLRPWLVDPNLQPYGAAAARLLRRRVFRPYVRHVSRLSQMLGHSGRVVSSRTGLGETRVSPSAQVSRLVRAVGDVLHGHRIVVLPARAAGSNTPDLER